MAVEQLTARILDRDYRLSCAPDEKAALLAAVDHVDHRMREIREQGKVTNAERIAVLAALNIAGSLLAREAGVAAAQPTPEAPLPIPVDTPLADEEIARRMRSINALLDDALGRQEPLF